MGIFDVKASDVPVSTRGSVPPPSDSWVSGALGAAANILGSYQENKARALEAEQNAAENAWLGDSTKRLSGIYDAGRQGGGNGFHWKSALAVEYRKAISQGVESGFNIDKLKKIAGEFGVSGSYEIEEAQDEHENEREARQAVDAEALKTGKTREEVIRRNGRIADIDLKLKEMQLLKDERDKSSAAAKVKASKTVSGFSVAVAATGPDVIDAWTADGFDPLTATQEQRQARLLEMQQLKSSLQGQLAEVMADYPDADFSFAKEVISSQMTLLESYANGKSTREAVENVSGIAQTSFENNLSAEAKKVLAISSRLGQSPLVQQAFLEAALTRGGAIHLELFGDKSPTQALKAATPEDKAKYKDIAPKTIESLSQQKETVQDAADMFKRVVDPDVLPIDQTNVQAMVSVINNDKTWGAIKDRVDPNTLSAVSRKVQDYVSTLDLSFNKWMEQNSKGFKSNVIDGKITKTPPERELNSYITMSFDSGQIVFTPSSAATVLGAPQKKYLEKTIIKLNNVVGKELNSAAKAFSRASGLSEKEALIILGGQISGLGSLERPAKEGVPELLKPVEPAPEKVSKLTPKQERLIKLSGVLSEEDLDLLEKEFS